MCNNSQGGEEENIPNEAKYERRAETNKPELQNLFPKTKCGEISTFVMAHFSLI